MKFKLFSLCFIVMTLKTNTLGKEWNGDKPKTIDRTPIIHFHMDEKIFENTFPDEERNIINERILDRMRREEQRNVEESDHKYFKEVIEDQASDILKLDATSQIMEGILKTATKPAVSKKKNQMSFLQAPAETPQKSIIQVDEPILNSPEGVDKEGSDSPKGGQVDIDDILEGVAEIGN